MKEASKKRSHHAPAFVRNPIKDRPDVLAVWESAKDQNFVCFKVKTQRGEAPADRLAAISNKIRGHDAITLVAWESHRPSKWVSVERRHLWSAGYEERLLEILKDAAKKAKEFGLRPWKPSGFFRDDMIPSLRRLEPGTGSGS